MSAEGPGSLEGPDVPDVPEALDGADGPDVPDAAGERRARLERRLVLTDRVEELEGKLRRTRFTVPTWLVGVVVFLWLGHSGGNLTAGLVLGSFAAVAAGVMHGARRRQREELRATETELRALDSGAPTPPEGG